MQLDRLFLRLGLGLISTLAPLAAEAATRPQVAACVSSRGIRVIRFQPPRCTLRAKAIPRPAVAQLPQPVKAAPVFKPVVTAPSGTGLKSAPTQPWRGGHVRMDAPDGSIANSQQRQAIAIGAVAVAVGAAIWMASREHAAQAKAEAEAGPDAPKAAPHFDDPADAHAYAVQLALAKARKP